jgi:hypothetical protein
MRSNRGLPIPFLILILAGVVSFFSMFATRAPQASAAGNDSLKLQTVEQERMAEFYFRVLSWISDLTQRNPEPVNAKPQPAPAPKVVRTPRGRVRAGRMELCTFSPAAAAANLKACAHRLN